MARVWPDKIIDVVYLTALASIRSAGIRVLCVAQSESVKFGACLLHLSLPGIYLFTVPVCNLLVPLCERLICYTFAHGYCLIYIYIHEMLEYFVISVISVNNRTVLWSQHELSSRLNLTSWFNLRI